MSKIKSISADDKHMHRKLFLLVLIHVFVIYWNSFNLMYINRKSKKVGQVLFSSLLQIHTFKCAHVVLLLYLKENVSKKILQAVLLLNWQKYIDAKSYTNSHLLKKSRLLWFILNKYGKSQHRAAAVALMLMNSQH